MPESLKDRENFIQALYWASYAKVIVGIITILIFATLFYSGGIDFDIEPIVFYLMPIFISINMALLWAARKRKPIPPFLIYPQALVSIFVVTAVIVISGKAHNEFLFLYIIPPFINLFSSHSCNNVLCSFAGS